MIARSPADLPPHFSCSHAVAIIDSANTDLRQAVLRQKLPALTCGRSGTDTFTLTSLTDDSAVVSMSRPICAFDAHTIEPFELPVSFPQPIDPFTLLAASAVFCLLGKHNPLAAQKKASYSPIAFFTTKINAFPRKNLQL